jgi:hypothetical protein
VTTNVELFEVHARREPALAIALALIAGCTESTPSDFYIPIVDDSSMVADFSTNDAVTDTNSEMGSHGDTTTGSDSGNATTPPWDDVCVAALPTGFCFVSTKGDYIGQGKVVQEDEGTGRISVHDYLQIASFDIDGASGKWGLVMVAPRDNHFIAGRWEMVQRYPFQGYSSAGLDFSGDGRGCNALSGFIDVTEIERSRLGEIARFSAVFEQHCENESSYLRGRINFNANGVPDLPPEDPSDCSVATRNGFCSVSQVGHPDATALSLSLDESVALFSARFTGEQLDLTYESTESSTISFKLPHDEPLKVKRYDDAVSTSSAYAFSKASMSGCADLEGWFEVRALEAEVVDVDGTEERVVSAADVDFSYVCPKTGEAVRSGKFRYSGTMRVPPLRVR